MATTELLLITENTKDISQLTDRLESLTADLVQRVAPELDRLKNAEKAHTKNLTEIFEELGRLNRNMETLQAGLKRVINKVVEQEQRIDLLVSRQEKSAGRQADVKESSIQEATYEEFSTVFDELFKDVGDIFKDMSGIFKSKSIKRTTTKV